MFSPTTYKHFCSEICILSSRHPEVQHASALNFRALFMHAAAVLQHGAILLSRATLRDRSEERWLIP